MTSSVDHPEMVDAQVLIYASLPTRKLTRDAGLLALHQTSLALVRRLPVVRVSAIAWLEFLRLLRTDERTAMETVLQKVVVERMDRRVAEFADELLRHRREKEAVCDRCLGTSRSAKCPKCGKFYSAQQRLNDALIVATAEVIESVKTLYSYDSGILELASYCKSCTIERPQSDTPLLDPATNRALASAIGTPHLASVPVSDLGSPASDDSDPDGT
jgi:predicted nucleic acid-binding protein